MSHEMRTPMTAILGYADLLREIVRHAPAAAEQVHAYLDTIAKNGAHLLSLINDILDLSKIEAGQMRIERIETAPARILHDVLSLMSAEAHAKSLTLHAAFETEMPTAILSDPVRLRQVLLNLVSNAVKFTERGSVSVRAALRVDESDCPVLRFEIVDTGIGMTPEQVARLFGAFEQADSSITRRFGGTGLGLHISKRLIEMLGGTIAVESEVGRGSKFIVTVPTGPLREVPLIDPESAARVVVESRTAVTAEANEELRGARILLAEDNPANRRLITHYLQRAGATVHAVEDGKRLIEALTADGSVEGPLRDPAPADLLITDIQMPEMDGYTATRLLRAKGCALPILALTAHAMPADADRCLAAGCDAHTTKPIAVPDLLATCSKFLRQPVQLSGQQAGGAGGSPFSLGGGWASDAAACGFEDDPELAALRREFLASLPGVADSLRQSLSEKRLDEVARIAHQLKGVGASYGFPAISAAARALEARLRDASGHAYSAGHVHSLVEVCRAACASAGLTLPMEAAP